ncbi:sodium/calcium exchanger NCL1-like [Magnolia sinica]|uniref:sodium/calcium exchanger NCL1-like n=1 Tax=Magnolia sinica TaxID=86752 RepID=UPI002658C59A|nr:sodium/calcium exchanger NCL1-like [Magnolia sinica]
MARATFPLLLLLLLSVQGQSRLITDHSSPDLISDGIRHVGQHSLLLLERLSSNSSEACEQTYGFLPCTTTVLGNLFLVLVYGCLMFLAAKFLSTGSELLLELLGPGIIGGLFLPILGALPDALLILVSGLSGSKETAQHQVLIGMGLLAGSTVMLLTLLWGSCVIVGKCDLLDHSTSIDSQDTKRCSLTGSGVTTDLQTSHAAKIMTISVIPFIIVQLPLIFNLQSERRLGVLVGLIVSIAFLIAYCLYQVFQPWIQKRRLAYAKHKHVIAGILRHVHSETALGRLLKDNGQPDTDVIKKLFKRIDEDNNNFLSIRELTALIIGIKFDEIDLDRDDAVRKVMYEFDTSSDNKLSEDEFVSGISKWVDHAKRSVPHATIDQNRLIHDFHRITKEEHDMLIDRSDEVVEGIDNPYWIYAKAISLLLLGAVIAAAFADPLVDAVTNFSNATSIPTFFISFIAMPLATNSSEAVSAIIFACRKKQRTTSLTFSEIYGGVTMNNILCLAVFLGLVYARHLTWDFSAEVLVILIVTVVMGLFTSFRTTFPLWTCAVAFIFYPFSLVLVYLLDYVFGWS